MNSLAAALRAQGSNLIASWEDEGISALGVFARADHIRQSAGLARGERILSMDESPGTLLSLLVLAEELDCQLVLGRPPLDLGLIPSHLRPSLVVHGPRRLERDISIRETTGEPGIFLMTSGTTGAPKVVHHTLSALLGPVQSSGLKRHEGARWLLTYETHSFAGLQVVLSAGVSGGRLVGASARTPPILAELARSGAVTHISGTPTLWRSLMILLKGGGLPSLRQITIGGEAVDQATLDRLAQTFPGARISHIYASTEAGSLFAVHDVRVGFPRQWLGPELPGGVSLRIRDGQLEAKSSRAMVAYATGQSTPLTEDGWLRTGDIVREEGDRVVFSGRKDSVVNVGGLKVFPEEIEEFLLQQPMVAEAHVYAVPSPLTGALLAARVAFRPGYGDSAMCELRVACAKGLPRHKQPRKFERVETVGVARSGKKERSL